MRKTLNLFHLKNDNIDIHNILLLLLKNVVEHSSEHVLGMYKQHSNLKNIVLGMFPLNIRRMFMKY